MSSCSLTGRPGGRVLYQDEDGCHFEVTRVQRAGDDRHAVLITCAVTVTVEPHTHLVDPIPPPRGPLGDWRWSSRPPRWPAWFHPVRATSAQRTHVALGRHPNGGRLQEAPSGTCGACVAFVRRRTPDGRRRGFCALAFRAGDCGARWRACEAWQAPGVEVGSR